MSSERVKNIDDYRAQSSREPIIHDLDALRPPPQIIALAGRRFDLGRIPSGVALEVVDDWERFQQETRALSADTDPERAIQVLDRSIDLVLRLLRRPISLRHFRAWRDSRISRRWLIRHTDIVQLQRFLEIAIALLFKSFGSTGEGGDANSPPQ